MLFDRSWYNRAGVEKVMGFCTPDQTEAFLSAAPEFERHLVDDGMLFFKYWLCCDQDGAGGAVPEPANSPMKRWKLSPIDIKARAHYEDYTEAREMMLAATHTDFAPWTLVDFNDQPLGRLTLLRDLLDRVPGHGACRSPTSRGRRSATSRSRSSSACSSRSRLIRSGRHENARRHHKQRSSHAPRGARPTGAEWGDWHACREAACYRSPSIIRHRASGVPGAETVAQLAAICRSAASNS